VVPPIVPVLVPPDRVNTTVSPPAVRLFPAASLACSVSEIGSASCREILDVVTVDALGDAEPGVTVIVGRADVTALPPMVAPLVVAAPAVPPVCVAAWVPFPLSVVPPIVPVLVPPDRVNTTVSPPAVRLFPAASLACSVSVAVAPDTTVLLDVVTVDVVGEAVPGVTVTVGWSSSAVPLAVADTVLLSARVEASVT